MGYTHYWTVHKDFTPEQWATLRNYVEPMIRELGVPISGPMGKGKPKINADLISLNGLGDDAYETFQLPRRIRDYDEYAREVGERRKAGAWAFCKTARNPYDAVVIRILAAAQQIAPGNLIPFSDGGEEVFSNLGKLIS